MLRISVPFRISFWYFLTFVSTLPFTHEIPSNYSIVSTITLHVISRFSIPFMLVSLHNTQRHPYYCKIPLHVTVGIPQSYCLVYLNNTAGRHLSRSSPHFKVSNHVTDGTLLKIIPSKLLSKVSSDCCKFPSISLDTVNMPWKVPSNY